ncbi:hypothetical protein DFR52_102228 [Hoeflea marina]|uniref:DUF937 domain-containing protein n=2 Tax=Hoeflea marina TaxID=274592 RepID=A0A317PKT5_9HYPH|nr:hypothetical protein DFR52_102228 [Hoeflea marina]
MPLFDMMMNAQNGEAIQMMARQFNLNREQVEKAMAALMPAFSTGLKRNAANPADLSGFLQALAGGDHARYFEDIGKAFTPSGMEEGNGILGHLFGSKEVSRAIAAQAAAVTGIGQEILKQMLPVMASAIMGGLYKQSMGQFGAANSGGGSTGNVIGDLMAEMMRQGMGGGQARPTQKASPMDNPLGQILEGMFGGAQAGKAPGDGATPFDNPLGKIFTDMMGNMAGMATAPSAAPPPEEASPESGNPYGEIFGKMFDSGREVQKGYQKNVDSIFDQYLKGMNRTTS